MNDLLPTIVIADDNPRILEVVARLLHASFTIVAQAEDGDAAFRAIKELRPQLAVLDLSMPKIDGMEVARQLTKAHSSTKVVFLTLFVGEEYINEARRCGHGYVIKTRLFSDLCPALKAALQDEFFASDSAEF